MGISGRRGRRWVVLTCLFALAVGGAVWGAGRAFFRTDADRARDAYARADWAAASALAGQRLKANPTDRESLVLLARSAARQSRDDLARSLYARLGGAGAMTPEDLFLFGRLIDRTGDHETARACWVAGLRADPKNAELLNEFARLYLEGGQLDLAERTAAALTQRPGWTARAEIVRAQIALARDDPAAASARLKDAFDADPALRGAARPPRDYQKLRARALLGAARPGEARHQLAPLATAGEDAETTWLLGRAGLQLGALPKDWGAAYRADHPMEREPSPYVGAARCGDCHAEQYQAQQRSLHARTFQRGGAVEGIPQAHEVVADPAAAKVRHTIDAGPRGVAFSTADEEGRTLRAAVDFAFGSGHRGLTLVGRDEAGRARELRLSYYADGPSWDVTTGHPRVPPPGEGYLGRVLSADDLDSCFACHTTAPGPARDNRGPTRHDRGIGCERCHGPGANHVTAVAAKLPDSAIVQPRAASSAEVVALCGQCHNPFHREVRRTDAMAVRFPATTLTWSRCYTQSAGGFDCRTCHDPHRDLEHAKADYDAKCRACHANAPAQRVCSVNARDGCVSCHMPKSKLAVPHSEFTDHFIRIHPETADRTAPRSHP
jgi:hypothetical protein